MPLVQKYNFSMTDSVRSTFHDSRYRKAIHIHQLAEIVFVLEGEMRVTTNGKRTVAKAGDLIVIPPYQPHGFYTENGKTVKLWMMLFSGNLISDISISSCLYNEYETSVFKPSEPLGIFIKSKFFDTGEKLIDLDAAGVRSIKAMLYPLLEEYVSRVPTVSEHVTKSNNVVAALIQYLSKNFYKNESISDIATAIGYSESYISHNLKKSINASFSDLRNSFRVDCAKNLLVNSEMSNFRVGLECGFNCQRSFDRAFKKCTGMTPLKYKELYSLPTKSSNL